MNGRTIYPNYSLMVEMFDLSNSEWVVWLDEDCHVTASDWLEKFEDKINQTPMADQFGDKAFIVLSLSH